MDGNLLQDQFNLGLIKLHNQELDFLLEYQDIFVWHKGELGIYNLGEHTIYTQGFLPCRITLRRLSFWEEAKVNC
jgi:hypothetical protein